MKITLKYFGLLLCFLSLHIQAASSLKLEQINGYIYAIIGELGNRSSHNFGNNATFGFVITEQGVVLIDSGGSYKGAKEIHKVIKTVTDLPVVKVINTGGQDHRWFGNDYFRTLGAEIISSKEALKDHKKRFLTQFTRLNELIGDDAISETEGITADLTFDSALEFTLGGVDFLIKHDGQAHTPGDSYVWLPQSNIIFTGDIVYINRMLGVGAQSNSKSWLNVFESMAKLKPDILIPGHGSVTTLYKAESDTYKYLLNLRMKVTEFMDDGGDLSDIRRIDWSEYKYLLNFESLSSKNAYKVYTELEWE